MRSLLSLLILVSIPSFGGEITVQKREEFRIIGYAVPETLAHKSLPPKLAKSLPAKAKSKADKALIAGAVKSWTKYFNPEVNVTFSGTTLAVNYNAFSFIKLTFVGVAPFVVQINNEPTRVTLDSESPLKSLMAAISAAGYRFSNGKKSAGLFDLMVNEAQAEPAGIERTVENSLILSSSGYLYSSASDSDSAIDIGNSAMAVTNGLVADGYLFPQWWNDAKGLGGNVWGFFSQTVKCDGQTAEGTIRDYTGNSDLKFKATRGGSFTLDGSGFSITANLEKGSLLGCGELSRLTKERDALLQAKSEDSKLIAKKEKYIARFENELSDACKSLSKIRPKMNLDCNDLSDSEGQNRFCKKMADYAPSTPNSFEYCTSPKCTSPIKFELTEQSTVSLESISRIHEFRKKYAKEIKEGIFSSEIPPQLVTKPDMSGERINQLKEALKEIFPVKDKESPSLTVVAAGIFGILDCCGDSSCKSKLANSKVNLDPSGNFGTETSSPANSEKPE